MYLHEYYHSSSHMRSYITKLAEEFGLVVADGNHGSKITSSIHISLADADITSVLSEFPGNCSSLVLSDIQGGFCGNSLSKMSDAAVNFSIALCKYASYGGLFVSGTSDDMLKTLVRDYGFSVVINNLHNPHSSRSNFFLLRDFSFDFTPPTEPHDNTVVEVINLDANNIMGRLPDVNDLIEVNLDEGF